MIKLLNIIFPSSIGRWGFVLRFLVIMPLIHLSMGNLSGMLVEDALPELSKLQALALVFCALYMVIYLYIPRLVNAGLRKWLALFLVHPVGAAVLTVFSAVVPTRKSAPAPPADDPPA